MFICSSITAKLKGDDGHWFGVPDRYRIRAWLCVRTEIVAVCRRTRSNDDDNGGVSLLPSTLYRQNTQNAHMKVRQPYWCRHIYSYASIPLCIRWHRVFVIIDVVAVVVVVTAAAAAASAAIAAVVYGWSVCCSRNADADANAFAALVSTLSH